ncbi:Ku protein [Streptomyces sp. NPDC002787]
MTWTAPRSPSTASAAVTRRPPAASCRSPRADLDNVPLPTAHAIELLGTLPADTIDPRQIGESSYYLAVGPAPSAVRPYVLLVEALSRRSQVCVVKLAVKGDRERLGMLRPLNGILVVNVLRWADEVRPPSGVAPAPADVNEAELAQALELIDACSVDTIDDIPRPRRSLRRGARCSHRGQNAGPGL